MKMCSFRLLFLILCVYLHSNIELSDGISCKNEKNEDVDWYIIYKLPSIESEKKGSYLRSGIAYAYLTSDDPDGWKLSSVSMQSQKSMLGRTLKGFRDKVDENEDVAYLFYNDQAPDTEKTAVGHLKGYLAFDVKSGVWVIHSIPKYTKPDKHEFPSNARPNGQTALCITFATESLNDICKHLLFCNPNIYDYDISKSIKETLDETSQSLFSKKPKFIRKPPFVRETSLKSLYDEEFTGFAKDNQDVVDLYSEIIGPKLEINLIVETWRRGAGQVLEPFCRLSTKVIDVQAINMTFKNNDKRIDFTYTQDHSKWAISQDSSSSMVCVADLNRMESQGKRGGGALCFSSKPVWKAFKNIVDDINSCPDN